MSLCSSCRYLADKLTNRLIETNQDPIPFQDQVRENVHRRGHWPTHKRLEQIYEETFGGQTSLELATKEEKKPQKEGLLAYLVDDVKEASMSEGVRVTCQRCSHTWIYHGKSQYYIQCSRCRTSINIRRFMQKLAMAA